jgi:hypothetical protein
MRPRTFTLTFAAGAAAAVTFALLRLRRRSASWRRGNAPPDTYRCACGQRFRVAGTGRHQVFWLVDAAEDDPVLGECCPACERPLPRDGESATDAGGHGRGVALNPAG